MNKFLKIIGSISMAAFAVAVVFAPKSTHAAANITLSPSTQSVTQGGDVVFKVLVDTGGDPVNAVDIRLTYTQANFDNVSFDYATSGFETQTTESGTGGNIQVTRTTATPKTGSAIEVATITLHSSAVGNALVAFTTGTAVTRSSDSTDITGTQTGGSYTITAAATPATPASPTSPSAAADAASGPGLPNAGTNHGLKYLALLLALLVAAGAVSYRIYREYAGIQRKS